MGQNSLNTNNLISQLLTAPEIAIEHLDLKYVDDRLLTIKRTKEGDQFQYVYRKKPISNSKKLERIKSLVIPPAWQDVRITHVSNGHLQAVGRDAKNRKQYRYHPLWSKVRNQTKFYKMAAFGMQLPQIREKIDQDLDLEDWSKEKVLALILRLMEETHIRIGNEQYAQRNKTYGLSTMRSRHVKLNKDSLRFEFVGKKGKKHNVTLRNKKLIKLVNRCEEIPGWELFQYYDKEGVKQSVDSSMVNNYIHHLCGDIFTAKDFRTWAATIIFFEYLLECGSEKNAQQNKKNILSAYDTAAKALGNTRNVCRKYYVHPLIANYYENQRLQPTFEKAIIEPSQSYMTARESAVLGLLNTYTPEFLTT